MFQNLRGVSLGATWALIAGLGLVVGCSPSGNEKEKKPGDANKAATSADEDMPAKPERAEPTPPQKIDLPSFKSEPAAPLKVETLPEPATREGPKVDEGKDEPKAKAPKDEPKKSDAKNDSKDGSKKSDDSKDPF